MSDDSRIGCLGFVILITGIAFLVFVLTAGWYKENLLLWFFPLLGVVSLVYIVLKPSD